MPRRRILVPLLAAVACAAAMLAFILGHELAEGTFRVYGTTTDVLPHKETLFFIALAVFGTGLTASLAVTLYRAAGGRLAEGARALGKNPGLTVAALAGFAVLATALVSWVSLQHTAVLLDEDLYRFQADLLREGRLYTTLPDPIEPFREFYAVQVDGLWTGIYPWGHIVLCLPGYLLGAPWLVPHLCAALAVVLTYLTGRELLSDDEVTPLVGAAVVALSPFVAFTCGTTHNSTTSLVLVNLGLLGLTKAVRRGTAIWALIAGLAFGLGLHSRPLNAISIATPAGLIALVAALRLRRPIVGLVGGFVAGLAPGVVAYLAINRYLTGDALLTASTLSHPDLHIFGFDNTPTGVAHTPLLAFGKSGTNLIRLVLWTTGSLAAGVALVAFVAGLRRRTSDLILLVPAVSLFCCYYFFFTSPGYDTGPFYYLDLVPLLGLVVGRTLVALHERLSAAGSGGDVPLRLIGAGAVASVLVAFMSFWPMQGIAGRSVTDNNLLPYRAAQRAGIHDAVVWMNFNPNYRSWKLPPIPPRPDLSDDVLYARYDDQSSIDLWNKLRGSRTFYTLIFEDDGARLEAWYPPVMVDGPDGPIGLPGRWPKGPTRPLTLP